MILTTHSRVRITASILTVVVLARALIATGYMLEGGAAHGIVLKLCPQQTPELAAGLDGNVTALHHHSNKRDQQQNGAEDPSGAGVSCALWTGGSFALGVIPWFVETADTYPTQTLAIAFSVEAGRQANSLPRSRAPPT